MATNFIWSILMLHVLCVWGQQLVSNNNAKELFFGQKLDHFDPQNAQKWQQRYFVKDGFYKSGGPYFLYIGGEDELSLTDVNEFYWITLAKRFGALCFALEHRYYGKSRPVKDLSLPNLKYLTTQQALADLATFIAAMNEKYNVSNGAKWIAFGGSYPGSLATWLRIKYPHLVYGVVASSPAITFKLDAGDYISLSLKQYELHSKKCLSTLREGVVELDKQLESAEGQRIVNKKFNLCTPVEKSVNDSKDLATLYSNVAVLIASVVKDDSTYQPSCTLKEVCNQVMAASNALDGLAAAIGHILKVADMDCLDCSFENKIKVLRNTSWFANPEINPSYERMFYYIMCNEFTNFVTSSAPPHILGTRFPLEYQILVCQYAFGMQHDLAFLTNVLKTTNVLYGGTDMVISNALFVRGTRDPWLHTQYSEKFKAKVPSITIEGATHVEDIYPETENDSPQLKLASSKIASVIHEWVNSK